MVNFRQIACDFKCNQNVYSHLEFLKVCLQIDFVSLFQVSVWQIHFVVANNFILKVSK
jgi:hypothetical protein